MKFFSFLNSTCISPSPQLFLSGRSLHFYIVLEVRLSNFMLFVLKGALKVLAWYNTVKTLHLEKIQIQYKELKGCFG
jgi:hypothetical protein